MKAQNFIKMVLSALTFMAMGAQAIAVEKGLLAKNRALQLEQIKQLERGGGESAGGGGTEVGLEFGTVLHSIVKLLEKDSELKKRFPEFTIDQLKSTLRAKILPRRKVQITKNVVVDNAMVSRAIPVVAANYPGSSESEWTIEVSESLWPALKNNECKRQILVLHEALGLLKLERDSYPISSRLCKPYGSDFLDLPEAPTSQRSFGGATSAFSNNSDFVRSEFHISKSQATKDQALREVELHKKSGALMSTLVESETEWIVLVIYSVLK